MEKYNGVDNINDEIGYVVDSIKNIEKQIIDIKMKKFFIFKDYRNKCFDRVKKLEDVKNYLYKRLEYIIEKEK